MHILVTAGNTLAPIDRVRCLTNIFTGRTGASIALAAYARSHRVTLLTSHPDVMAELHADFDANRWSLCCYRTFDDLRHNMAIFLKEKSPDVLVHCAAVSDYLAAGVYAPGPNTHFRRDDGRWETNDPLGPAFIDRAAAKIKSDEPELWLRLVRSPKLIDLVRSEWGFRGTVVKFKLEVGIDDEQLLQIAEKSRRYSAADLMVANTLEGSGTYAFLGPVNGTYQRISRRDLSGRLIEAVEILHGGTSHG